MRLGALAAIGYERPANLLHVVLDNGMHESTGGQATVARSVDLAGVAAACGYPRTHVVLDPEELREIVTASIGQLTFVRAMITPGTIENLPRPNTPPAEITKRFCAHIRELGKDSW